METVFIAEVSPRYYELTREIEELQLKVMHYNAQMIGNLQKFLDFPEVINEEFRVVYIYKAVISENKEQKTQDIEIKVCPHEITLKSPVDDWGLTIQRTDVFFTSLSNALSISNLKKKQLLCKFIDETLTFLAGELTVKMFQLRLK